jgi:hypothetical protein
MPESWRSDVQLEAILDVAGDWTVNGARGEVLCAVSSLRLAIEKARKAACRVSAVVRGPSDDIIVFAGQIERIDSLIKADGP